jgi:hypothetical protein
MKIDLEEHFNSPDLIAYSIRLDHGAQNLLRVRETPTRIRRLAARAHGQQKRAFRVAQLRSRPQSLK